MKVIIAMNMGDIVSLLYLQRIVFTSHTEKKMLLQNDHFANNII